MEDRGNELEVPESTPGELVIWEIERSAFELAKTAVEIDRLPEVDA